MIEFRIAVLVIVAFVGGFGFGHLVANTSSPGLGVIGELIAQSIAVLIGAAAAFALERTQRTQESRKVEATAGNRILMDLIRTSNHLRTYKTQIIDGGLARSPSPKLLWATLAATYLEDDPRESLDISRLEFFLGSGASQLVAEIDLLRVKRAGFVQAVNHRADVMLKEAQPGWFDKGLVLGTTVTDTTLRDATGPAVYKKLLDLTKFIVDVVPDYIADSDRLFRELRKELRRRYPELAFIDMAPLDTSVEGTGTAGPRSVPAAKSPP